MIAGSTLKAINIAIHEIQKKEDLNLTKPRNYFELCLLKERNQLAKIESLSFNEKMDRIPNFVLSLPEIKELIFTENSVLYFDKDQLQSTKIEKIWIGTKQVF